MSTHNKDDDFQLRVRKIAIGFLVDPLKVLKIEDK